MGASTIVIIIVFVLDLIAFGLGIGAEQRRATGHYVNSGDETQTQWCQYDSDIATGLAAGALLFLLTAQLLVSIFSRCLCCGNSLKPGAARAFAVIFFILNWLSFLVAAICFVAGAVQNAKHIRYISSELTTDKPTCSAIRKDTFAAGVAFTFFTFLLSVGYYLCWSRATEGSWKNQYNNRGDTGVNMASYA